MSYIRTDADPITFSRRKLMARDACVKDRQRTAELAGFFRATVPTVPRPHLKTGRRLHEIATCEKRSDPMCEGPNAWHRRETSDARNTEPTQRCSTGSTTFTDITSFTSFTNITNIASTTIPSKKTEIDSTSYPHSGKFLSLVSEKFRRVIGLVRELPVSNSPFDTNVDSPVSRYELAPEVHGRADRVVLVSGDKHKSIEDSSVHAVIESSTMGAHLSTTSEDEDSCNTSIQHFQMGHRRSLESVIRHSLFELPVESQTADLTGDGQSANSDDVISHSIFERHPSIVEDDSSRCYHLFPSADARDLSESDSINLFELSPPLHRTKVARFVCEHEIDLTLRPTLSWTVDEEDSTCRTLTVAPSCPPNSPRNSGELQSLAGVSTKDFPLPSIYGQLGSDNTSHRIDPGSMDTLLRISREQAPRTSESGYKKSPTEFARAKHSCESPFFRPGRHVHPPRHGHTESLRTTSCPILHVSLPIAP